tara:strand:+ start:678 stop:893 length:216 start_codon:yes stop_codon:yes gene_type:complete
MKTNISVELTDEQRLVLGKAWHGKAKPIARKELIILVRGLLNHLANKNYGGVDGSVGWVLNFYPKSLKIKK